jgi:hypothetical protein
MRGNSPVIRVAGFLLLKVSAVGKEQFGELGGAWCRVDGAAEAVPDQCRNVSAVVQVRVSEDNGINVCRVDGKGVRLRSRRRLYPWKSPHSTRIRRPRAWTRNLDPVTVSVAPRNRSLGRCSSMVLHRVRRSGNQDPAHPPVCAV